MDILTHAGVGLIAASPFLADRPELALGIVAGSVLPDLDAVCRLVGKQAFLRAHQSWSHALPVHLALSVGIGAHWETFRAATSTVFANLQFKFALSFDRDAFHRHFTRLGPPPPERKIDSDRGHTL